MYESKENHEHSRKRAVLPVHLAVCSTPKVTEAGGYSGQDAPLLRRGTHGAHRYYKTRCNKTPRICNLDPNAPRAPTFVSSLRFRLLPEPALSRTVLMLKYASLKLPASAFEREGDGVPSDRPGARVSRAIKRWNEQRNNEGASYSAGLVSRTFAVRRGDD